MELPIFVSIETKKDRIQRVSLSAHPDGFAYQILGSPSSYLLQQVSIFFNNYKYEPPLPPLAWDALTLFSKKVLETVQTLSFGETQTYGEIAAKIGQPKAARAVGGACRSNPFPLFLPCHRVVSSVSIGGFSGGVDLKKFLLDFENFS